MPLIQIAEPSVEPVSVAEVIDAFHGDDVDAFTLQATRVIKSMRRHAEARTGRTFITQTLELVLDGFPQGVIDLLLPKVQSIATVKYLDVTGTEQTLDSSRYSLDNVSTPSRLFPAYGTVWPDTIAMANALRIRFDAGYGADETSVPEDIRDWIITHATLRLESPDGHIDQAFRPLPFVDRLLDPYIVYRAF